MEPPIQTEYFLSGGAMILILMVEGARAVISFCMRSATPSCPEAPPCTPVLLTACRRRSPPWLPPPSRSRSPPWLPPPYPYILFHSSSFQIPQSPNNPHFVASLATLVTFCLRAPTCYIFSFKPLNNFCLIRIFLSCTFGFPGT